jgi:UDP-N-acetylglucosamine--dolichyl-phosphate N-acetylglucosaminephosphotransferase
VIEILIAFVIALLISLLALPPTIKLLKERGVCGIDVHKLDRPEIPKGAGFVFLFATVTGLLIVIGLTTLLHFEVNPGLLAALVSILMAGMIGQLDDILDFKNRTKIILPLLASIPMMAMQVGTTTMAIPFVGVLDLGLLYPLVVVPLMTTFIIDATNMYGGMNGLEMGLASVNASAIVTYVVLSPMFVGVENSQGKIDAGVVAAAVLGAALIFLFFNKYPAKVLPGDVGRLPLGAAMAAALILGNMDRMAILLYIPFGINFILYILYRIYVKRKGIEYEKFAKPREDGSLEVIGPFTAYWVLPYMFKGMTEKKNVLLLILFQAILAYGGVVLHLLGYPFGIGLI